MCHIMTTGSLLTPFGQLFIILGPIFVAITNYQTIKDYNLVVVYPLVLPIILGVFLTSWKSFTFTWWGILVGIITNQLRAFKTVKSKDIMNKEWSKEIGVQNTYAIINMWMFLLIIPLVIVFDSQKILPIYREVIKSGKITHSY